MKRFTKLNGFVVLTLATLVGLLAVSTLAKAQAESASSDSAIRGTFPVTLAKSLDSKKLKDGDPVVGQTAAPIRLRSNLIPTGTKLLGHVTQAQARSKGDSTSSLAFIFDKIEVTKGREMPMKGTLQAIAPALGKSGPDTASSMGSGQMIAGHGDPTTIAPVGGGSGPNIGIHNVEADNGPHPILNNQSLGVHGFKNMEMDKDAVITSSGKEVKLDDGTQLMVKAEIPIPVQ